ncbi:MAG: TrmH family RNA methyltransferase [Bacteroidetes bacterium]|jgi:tRNA G18 (ribose-2'-O)-methylase SpoU|nr:TrmH family RNA methyltransferase [Bacteroidota bacterium]
MNRQKNHVIITDNIRSAQNIGSIFRTCDALGYQKIYLCGISATPPNKEIAKTALGATETVSWEYIADVNELIIKLKEVGYVICSIEQTTDSIMLQDFKPNFEVNYAFVLGNEVDGVSTEIVLKSDICLEIPQFGSKKSFNVSVAAGIVLWDVVSKSMNKL